MLRNLRTMVASAPKKAPPPSSPLRTRHAHWKAAAPAPLPDTTTFAAQSSLPHLPVPKLQTTFAQLKDSLKPLARSPEEYDATLKKIADFEHGMAPTLHKRLQARAKKNEHWLEEWWDTLGYLSYRDSVVINVSYYYGFTPQPQHLSQTPAARAAGLARGAMLFRKAYKQGLLTPEQTKEGPICMDTYRWMFDCCRVPGKDGVDWSVSYAKEGDMGDTGHIVVFRSNRPWVIQGTDKNGNILSTDDFERQIQHIYDNSTEEGLGVGVMSASNRDDWAKNYENLLASPHNASVVETIQSAAFTISLDSAKPNDDVEHSRFLWHGHLGKDGQAAGLQNRWVDKPVQFIVYDNAEAGLMGEHSIMDGTPTARLCDDILGWLHDPEFNHGRPSRPPPPKALRWEVTPELQSAVKVADEAAQALIGTQTLTFYEAPYGKNHCKNFGVSPDAWAQMIIQLAYKRLLGGFDKRQGGTYEAATTRKFLKGRTEAIRVVSSEADAWVESMDDPESSLKERKRKFDAAAKKHIQIAKTAGSGQGIDRHLLGMKLAVEKDEEVPALFSDDLYKRASNWVLSTSAVFSKNFDVYGWGEVTPEGFGVPYMTGHSNRTLFTLTSRKEMPNEEFQEELKKASWDLYNLHVILAKPFAKL